MKILLLNQTFYPDVASTAQHASDLAHALVQRGHEVLVVCSRRAYDDHRKSYASREVWNGVRIHRISCTGFGKRARWRRAIDFGSFLINCVRHLATRGRFDVVVAMTSPPLISWIGALFTAVKGGRFVFWVMDLNPDEALAAGWLRPESRSTKLLAGMLNYSLRRSSAIIALDRFMSRRIAEKGITPQKIAVIPPWSHDAVVRYDAEGRKRFRFTHGLSAKFVVMYSGNHSPCHPLTTLLEAARSLRERSDIAFCFVGGGSEFDTVRLFAREHRLANVVQLPYQPLSMLSASLSSADLHVVIMGDPFVGIVHPCKVYNIRALGIPYLYIGPAESHITELQPTFSARHGDVGAVVEHISHAQNCEASKETEKSGIDMHGQQSLLEMMVSVLEDGSFAQTCPQSVIRTTSLVHSRRMTAEVSEATHRPLTPAAPRADAASRVSASTIQ